MAAGMKLLDSADMIDVSDNANSPAIAVPRSPDVSQITQLCEADEGERIVDSLKLNPSNDEPGRNMSMNISAEEELYFVTPPKSQSRSSIGNAAQTTALAALKTSPRESVGSETTGEQKWTVPEPRPSASASVKVADQYCTGTTSTTSLPEDSLLLPCVQSKVNQARVTKDMSKKRSSGSIHSRASQSTASVSQTNATHDVLSNKLPVTARVQDKKAIEPDEKTQETKWSLPTVNDHVQTADRKALRLSEVAKIEKLSPLPLAAAGTTIPAKSATAKLRSRHAQGRLSAVVSTKLARRPESTTIAPTSEATTRDPRLQHRDTNNEDVQSRETTVEHKPLVRDVYELEISPTQTQKYTVKEKLRTKRVEGMRKQEDRMKSSSKRISRRPAPELHGIRAFTNTAPPRLPLPVAPAGERNTIDHVTTRTMKHESVLSADSISVSPRQTLGAEHLENTCMKDEVMRPDMTTSTNPGEHPPQDVSNLARSGVLDEGVSQQYAIVVSDNETSSEDDLVQGRLQNERQPRRAVLAEAPITPVQPELSMNWQPRSATSARKVNIVGFDRTGPLNQGRISAGKSSSPIIKPTWLDKNKQKNTNSSGSKRSSGERGSVHTRSFGTLVAATTSDALPFQSNVAESVHGALTGLMDYTHKKPASSAKSLASPARANQGFEHQREDLNAIHGTSIATTSDDDSTVNDIYHMSSAMHDFAVISHDVPESGKFARTASQLAMPPPSRKRKMTLDGLGRSSVQDTIPDRAQPESVMDTGQHVGNSGRPSLPAGDRYRRPEIHPPAQGLQASYTTKPEASSSEGTNTRLQPRSTPANMNSLKRRKSNHTVDVGGSPIPHDMDVAEISTVLETYAQQADPSVGRLPDVKVTANPELKHHYRTPSVKTTPTTRYLASDTVVHHSLKTPPVLRVQNSSGVESQKTEPLSRAMLGSKEGTRWHAPDHSDRKEGQVVEHEHVRQVNAASAPTASEDLKAQVSELRDHLTATSARASAQRADFGRVQPSTIEKQDVEARNVLACGYAVATGLSEPAMADSQLKTWRAALSPRHLDLHDELVNIAHRLTKHLVDEETATRQALEDYRRRSLTYIEKMEAQRREMYAQLEHDVERRRALTRSELMTQKRWLQDFVQRGNERKEKRIRDAEKRCEAYRKVERLIAD